MDPFLFLVFLLLVFLAFQNFTQRRLRMARDGKIRQIERKTESRLITLIHRQERTSILGFTSSRYIDMDDAQAVIHAIRTTPADKPISLVLHTPGGIVLAAMQIARAVKSHPAKVTVYVPVLAMSGGTLIALAADEIVMGDFSVLGPIDPQIAGIPAPSIVNVKAQKPASYIHDATLVLADVGEKAIAQLRKGAFELMAERMGEEKAHELADRLTRGDWTHDYAITATEAGAMGLSVSTDLPEEVLELMTLYPQPIRQQQAVDYLPSAPGGEKADGGLYIWR